jgi:hypothetical protein
LKRVLFILSFIIGISFTSVAQTSLDNTAAQLKYIKTYPNPASTEVNLVFQTGYNRNFSIQILNSIGKKMYEAKYIPSFLTINLKEQRFYRGIYIYQLLDRNGTVIESGKILVVD